MRGKREELKIPLKFKEAVADFLKVKPPENPKKTKKRKAKQTSARK